VSDATEQPAPLHPEQLTWAVLLGRWVSFARSAVALPADDAAARKMRDSISDVIMLQAMWFTLNHVDELEPHERALGLDRAAVLIDQHAAALEQRWADDPMPDTMRELIDDARQQLQVVSVSSSDSSSSDNSSTNASSER
jgi:hypothetical protein